MRGADVIANALRAAGVDTVFCYPGGANLEILDALSAVAIRLVRTEHEQGAAFAAQGFARASGRLGVCLATSGPGATNLVTGIADANSDSIPVLAITGNVATKWLNKNAFQEVDIVSVTKPITKWSLQVRDPARIADAIFEAVERALSGRPGPVLLDFPKDIQQARVPDESADVSPRGALASGRALQGLDDSALREIEALLGACERPVIYAGGGVLASGTGAELARLAETLQSPVALTLMGLGAMPADHPLFLGPLGMHGAWRANCAVNESDLVIALGVRFDDRVIGDPAAFGGAARIIHIDIDARELGKNKPADVRAEADLRVAFAQLLALAKPRPTRPWLDYLARVHEDRPLAPPPASATLLGPRAIALLGERLPEDAVVTTGVGQHQMWAMQFVRPSRPRSFLSSSGFGTMGFGLPAAIGAKLARPASTVVDIDGDGSLNMTINELGTCHRYGIGVKVFVVNNQWLGMVRQWQDMIYARNRVVSALAKEAAGPRNAPPYPDFLAIAAGYGVRAERVSRPSDLDGAIARMLADPQEPYVLDVMVERESDVYPMIPSGKSYRDVLFGPQDGGASDT